MLEDSSSCSGGALLIAEEVRDMILSAKEGKNADRVITHSKTNATST